MSDVTTRRADLAVRASDAEREQTVALLQRNFADGRLTRPSSRNGPVPPTQRGPGPSYANSPPICPTRRSSCRGRA